MEKEEDTYLSALHFACTPMLRRAAEARRGIAVSVGNLIVSRGEWGL